MEFSELESKLNYKFEDIEYLREALSHPSLKGEDNYKNVDYERLEFLGDTVINLVVTETLYREFPDLDEGELAKIRSYYISKDFMVKRGKEMNLGLHIIMGPGEESTGGRDNPNSIENVLEAIMGAIYLDKGLESAKNVIRELWGEIDPAFGDLSNPKSTLQEILQQRKMPLPKYEVVEKTGEAHSPTYKVRVEASSDLESFGMGGTIKAAEKQAAENMIKILENSNAK